MPPSRPPQSLTRRRFIHLVGRAGGAAAAYNTMMAMGLLRPPLAYAGPPVLDAGSGRGRGVIIVGAGIAGMVAALELQKAGYRCTLLEARTRPGGRCWTIRGGDRVEETDSTQTAAWPAANHLYFNPGPGRIPQHHAALLGYCREFGVPLQVMVDNNPDALVHDEDVNGGRPVSIRQFGDDARGYVSELLAKALDGGAVDLPVDAGDRQALAAFVREFGSLNGDSYRGPRPPPGAALDAGRDTPLALAALIDRRFWRGAAGYAQEFGRAPVMLEPVGGMDRIAMAFADQLQGEIIYGAEVTEIRRAGEGCRVVYRDRTSDTSAMVEAPLAIVTMPLSVLAGIDADFSPLHRAAIDAATYLPAAKIAFHARRRFWEEDNRIFGGVSWTTQDITQIWYPSTGFHRTDGILIGGYVWTGAPGELFAAMAPAERLRLAVEQGERLHPGSAADLAAGVAVSWARVPFSAGAWCEWSAAARRGHVPVLMLPDGPFHFAGEHLSELPGWQEGAVLSAHHAVRGIAAASARQ